MVLKVRVKTRLVYKLTLLAKSKLDGQPFAIEYSVSNKRESSFFLHERNS
jgi:hypothetical protein